MVDRFFDWKMPKKYYAIFVGIGLVLAMFKTWQEEKEKNQAAAVYLVPDDPQIVVDAVNHHAFPVGRTPQLNFAWRVFGQSPALNMATFAICYVEPDTADQTQDAMIQDFRQIWAKAIKPKESSDLFPGPDRRWGTCAGKENITEETRKQILHGDKFVFLIGAAEFKDGAGYHEAHLCKWLGVQPSDSQDLVGPGVWHDCKGYTTQIDISGP